MEKYIQNKIKLLGGAKPKKAQLKKLEDIKEEFKSKLMKLIQAHLKLGGSPTVLAGKKKAPRKMSEERKQALKTRGQKISKLMKKLGISLPEASKLLKKLESKK